MFIDASETTQINHLKEPFSGQNSEAHNYIDLSNNINSQNEKQEQKPDVFDSQYNLYTDLENVIEASAIINDKKIDTIGRPKVCGSPNYSNKQSEAINNPECQVSRF